MAVELEVLAKKFDRFGWTRDMGTPAHDRIITDWMDALQDFPLNEIQAACRAAVEANPNRMPNEGHIRALVHKARAKQVRALPQPPEPEREVVTAERAEEILREAGITPKAFR